METKTLSDLAKQVCDTVIGDNGRADTLLNDGWKITAKAIEQLSNKLKEKPSLKAFVKELLEVCYAKALKAYPNRPDMWQAMKLELEQPRDCTLDFFGTDSLTEITIRFTEKGK